MFVNRKPMAEKVLLYKFFCKAVILQKNVLMFSWKILFKKEKYEDFTSCAPDPVTIYNQAKWSF